MMGFEAGVKLELAGSDWLVDVINIVYNTLPNEVVRKSFIYV